MDQECDRLYPSAPLKNKDIEQRLEKKIISVLITISTTLRNWSNTLKTKIINQKKD